MLCCRIGQKRPFERFNIQTAEDKESCDVTATHTGINHAKPYHFTKHKINRQTDKWTSIISEHAFYHSDPQNCYHFFNFPTQ
jgi:hypothetical protein